MLRTLLRILRQGKWRNTSIGNQIYIGVKMDYIIDNLIFIIVALGAIGLLAVSAVRQIDHESEQIDAINFNAAEISRSTKEVLLEVKKLKANVDRLEVEVAALKESKER
jgi:hypothetical protein